MAGEPDSSGVVARTYGGGQMAGREPANLGDILERVLDKGIVIAGDIRVNLLDIELLTIKLRLLIVSVETARELGIDWWERDPWLNAGQERLEKENKRLRDRLSALEEADDGRGAVRGGDDRRRAVEGPEAERAAEPLPKTERES